MTTKVTASQETVDFFGKPIIDFIARTSSSEKQVVIVTPADTKSGNLKKVLDQAGIGRESDSAEYRLGNKNNAYNQTIMGNDGPVSLTMFGKTIPADTIFASLLHMNLDVVPKITAMNKDQQTLTLFHELAHSERDPRLPQILVELDADRRANAKYRQALSEGVVTAPDAPEAKGAMRIMQSMMDTSLLSMHENAMVFAPHALACLGGSKVAEKIQTEVDGLQAYKEMMEAKRAILIKMGEHNMPERDIHSARLVEVSRMVKNGKIQLPEGKMDELSSLLGRAYEEGGSSEQIKAALDQLPISTEVRAELDRRTAKEVEEMKLRIGFDFAKDNPDQLLKTANEMQQAGTFRGHIYAEAFVGGFVEGAHKYAPAHFTPSTTTAQVQGININRLQTSLNQLLMPADDDSHYQHSPTPVAATTRTAISTVRNASPTI